MWVIAVLLVLVLAGGASAATPRLSASDSAILLAAYGGLPAVNAYQREVTGREVVRADERLKRYYFVGQDVGTAVTLAEVVAAEWASGREVAVPKVLVTSSPKNFLLHVPETPERLPDEYVLLTQPSGVEA